MLISYKAYFLGEVVLNLQLLREAKDFWFLLIIVLLLKEFFTEGNCLSKTYTTGLPHC